jgi:hypothetical protein
MKNLNDPPSGIEPATFRLVAQYLNQRAPKCSYSRRSIAFFEGSQASPACPSGKIGIKMKLSVEHFRIGSDRRKTEAWNLSREYMNVQSLPHSKHTASAL